ncbi:I78 family peptidase inhibitor [Pseudomonas sp. RIT-PI-S]|uniref:I78 family peptidase inhibitor n=1 Tax=Pseudomonas sp. RIT-PI-S TaxID=3035295 RepID=UPI0021DB298B|nr:I78 family peptidase inhibitor [Pseudomonas sp. RIT-PI-S]
MTNEQIIETLQPFVGTPYAPGVKAAIGDLTGRSRVVGPREFTTREFDPQRIHILVDASGTITGFTFN